MGTTAILFKRDTDNEITHAVISLGINNSTNEHQVFTKNGWRSKAELSSLKKITNSDFDGLEGGKISYGKPLQTGYNRNNKNRFKKQYKNYIKK